MWQSLKFKFRLHLRNENVDPHEFKKAFYLILGVKIFLTAYVLISVNTGLFHSLLGFFESLMRPWIQWDSQHYLAIARHGYAESGPMTKLIVFFPLYPLLIKLGTFITQDYYWAAWIVSNILSLFGGLVFFSLAYKEWGSSTAWKSLVLLLSFPTAYFFSAAYTEGPFLFLSLMCFWYLRKNAWLAAGIWGGLAALTRIQGAFLFIPLTCQILLDFRTQKKFSPLYLWAGLIPAAIGIYLLINHFTLGNFFAFTSQVDKGWTKEFVWPWESLFLALVEWRRNFTSPGIVFTEVEGILAALLLLIGCIVSAKKLPLVYTSYLIGITVLCLSVSWLQSTSRYALTTFPLFYALGIYKWPLPSFVIWIVFSLLLLLALVTRFTSGQWAF